MSKYEFYKKLLGNVTLFRVIPDVTWIQPNLRWVQVTAIVTLEKLHIFYNLDF